MSKYTHVPAARAEFTTSNFTGIGLVRFLFALALVFGVHDVICLQRHIIRQFVSTRLRRSRCESTDSFEDRRATIYVSALHTNQVFITPRADARQNASVRKINGLVSDGRIYGHVRSRGYFTSPERAWPACEVWPLRF
jgi:hypothetical protein